MAASSVRGPQGDHCINLEWDIINACNDTLLTDCATAMSQFIKKFNGVVRSFQKIIADQKQSEEKFSKLSDHCQQLENCKKCVKLQNRLDDQVSKMQTLATIFGQISNENVGSKMKLVKAKDMFTQMVEDNYGTERENQPNDNQNLIYGKRPRECVKSPTNGDSKEENESDMKHEVMLDGLVTPKKRIRTSERSPGKRAQSSSKRETGKKDLALSPIIGKGKHRSAVTRSEENKTPLTNLSNRLDITDTFVTSSPESKSPSNNRKSTDGEPSPSLLRNPAEEEMKPSPNLLPPNQPDLDVTFTEEKSQAKAKRDSLSLLQKNIPKNISPDTSISQLAKKCKRSLNSKKLKQARLSFSNMKMKEPSDVSMQDSFCGGLRTFSSTAGMSKTDEEEMLKIAVQRSLNESLMNNLTEDDDVIDASPSNQQKPAQKKKIRKQRQRNATSANVDSVTIQDDEDTIMFTTREKRTSGSPTKRSRTIANDKPTRKGDDFAFPLLVENENQSTSNQSLKQESATSPLKSLKKISPTKDASHIYLEPVVRKKAEKMNLPGWSCKKCKDFYEAAFKGNEDMIREKMNECSRHRGKFNPEREDTPAGFWDLNMPPTQDTEAFNKRNNRD